MLYDITIAYIKVVARLSFEMAFHKNSSLISAVLMRFNIFFCESRDELIWKG